MHILPTLLYQNMLGTLRDVLLWRGFATGLVFNKKRKEKNPKCHPSQLDAALYVVFFSPCPPPPTGTKKCFLKLQKVWRIIIVHAVLHNNLLKAWKLLSSFHNTSDHLIQRQQKQQQKQQRRRQQLLACILMWLPPHPSHPPATVFVQCEQMFTSLSCTFQSLTYRM